MDKRVYPTNLAGQYLILISLLTYVAPVLRKIPFPCLPPTLGGKTGILSVKKKYGLPCAWHNISFRTSVSRKTRTKLSYISK